MFNLFNNLRLIYSNLFFISGVLFLVSFSHLASAEISIINKDIPLKNDSHVFDIVIQQTQSIDSQTSIIKRVYQEDVTFDEEISTLLKRFRDEPDNLDVIKQLNVNDDPIIDYVAKHIRYSSNLSELPLLLEALSMINTEKASNYLVSLGMQYSDDADLTISMLKRLREISNSKNIDVYFNALLQNNPENYLLIRNVLLSLVIYDSPDLKRWAINYRSPGIDSEIRYLGLYLSSLLLKDEKIQQQILQILLDEKKPPVYQHYYLLKALSRQMTDEYFYDFLSRSYVSPLIKESVVDERKFYQGDNAVRLQLATRLLNNRYPDQYIAVITFLLKHQGFDKAWDQLNQSQRLSAIRLSYKFNIPMFINSEPKEIIFKEEEKVPASKWLLYGLISVCLFLFLVNIKTFKKFISHSS